MLGLLIFTTAVSVLRSQSTSVAATMSLKAADFEVFGRVQGVFFRKYTKDQADNLGLRGWCKNTAQGTVVGHIQGPDPQVEEMMHWLKTTGSPSSLIDKAEFRNVKAIYDYAFQNFSIKKE